MSDHCLDVSRAVGGHVRPDWVEVLPEIGDGLDDGGCGVSSVEHVRFAENKIRRREGIQSGYHSGEAK